MLQRFQAEGLIATRRGSGTFLQRPPFGPKTEHLLPADVRRLLATLEVRIAPEPVAARLAAQNGSDQERAAAEACGWLGRGNVGEGPEFHHAIAAAAHNPMFELVPQILQAQAREVPLGASSPVPGEHLKAAADEHAAIATAVAGRELEVAEAAMRLHLLRARGRLSGIYSRRDIRRYGRCIRHGRCAYSTATAARACV